MEVKTITYNGEEHEILPYKDFGDPIAGEIWHDLDGETPCRSRDGGKTWYELHPNNQV